MSRLNSPLICALAVALVFSVFIFGRLRLAAYDFSSFVTAGDVYCDPSKVPPGLTVLRNSAGFDGQFYYRLALNPFTSRANDFGITIDHPPLRHQRILYPLLTWMLSLGNPSRVPLVMVLINFLGLVAMGWIGGHYAQVLKQHALWGIFLPLYPGFMLTLSRDLVEILEITLLLASLLLLRRARTWMATALLCLAVLTKETSVLVAVAALLFYVYRRWKNTGSEELRWYYFAAPMIVYAAWQLTLFYIWGTFPLRASGEANLGIPLVAPAAFAWNALRTLQRPNIIEAIFLAGFCVAVLVCLRATMASALEILVTVLFAVLALSLGHVVWTEDWTFLRAASQFCVFGTIVVLGAKAKSRSLSRPFVFALSGLFWLYLFARLMRHYS
ncbi:MAG TPA: hypothetical protein VJT71_05555 [Pyrinomonadaceae bacterium]|nr:hypothetical protein [Pyrinomonadaceae bacterium]